MSQPQAATPITPTATGVNVAVMGPAGTGKTFSIGTLVDSGLEVFYLSLESGLESLLGYYSDTGKPIPPNLHWHQFKTQVDGFASMIDSAKKINLMSLDSLAKMADPQKSKYDQFVKFLEVLSNFPCDRTGQKFGAVDSWGPDKVLVIDGLTGLGNIAMALVIGGKPVRNQSDWGIAQGQVENVLRQLCDGCKCHFVLLAHVERETDPVLGGVKIMMSSLGKALAPKLPSMFSDIILATRQGSAWTWDTNSSLADVKSRNLPLKADNKPDFRPIIEKWRARVAAANAPQN